MATISPSSTRLSKMNTQQGPQLRQGLRLYRVVNNTGLKVREGPKLDSRECSRIGPGEVFGVNDVEIVRHRKRRVTRLRVVQPQLGWVTGSEKWVEHFSDPGAPGPVPLRSTLNDTCPVVMKCDLAPSHVSGGDGCEIGHEDSRGPRQTSPRSTWLQYRWTVVNIIPSAP